jgi:hypothetical protein
MPTVEKSFLIFVEMAGAEGFEPPLAVLETAGLPLNLRPYSERSHSQYTALLGLAVRLMLPAVEAELLEFNAFGGGLLVLGLGIVPVLALRALERDDFSGHCKLLLLP